MIEKIFVICTDFINFIESNTATPWGDPIEVVIGEECMVECKIRAVCLIRTARGFMAFTAAISRGGFEITGPLPLITSNSMPMAGSGVKMSENMMTPSIP